MHWLRVLLFLMAAFSTDASLGQQQNETGAADKEIRIGNIMPYSGPASSYALIGRTEAAYFRKVNDEGGINGRKIVFISYDDAFSPPKAVEQARRLVESDEVLLIFQSLVRNPRTPVLAVRGKRCSAVGGIEQPLPSEGKGHTCRIVSGAPVCIGVRSGHMGYGFVPET